MHRRFSPVDTQYWSWRVDAFILTLALTAAVFVVYSPVVWVGIATLLIVGIQFSNPISGLAVVIFSCGLLSYSPFEAGVLSRLYPGDLAIALFIFVWLIRCESWSFPHLFRPNLINRPLLGMAVVTSASMLWSRFHPDPAVNYSFPQSDVSWTTAQASHLVLFAATICMPFAVAAAIRTWKDIETVIIVMGSAAAFGTVITLAALILGFGGTYSILGATRAYWEQPWDSSMEPLCSLVFPFLCAAVLLGRRNLSRYGIMCTLFVFCFLGLVLTFSRESWLLAAAGTLIVMVLWIRRQNISLISCMTLAIVFFGALASGAISVVSRFYNPDQVYGLERIYFYVTAVQLFITHPLLGVGAGNYQFFDRTYAEVSAGGIAHNQFLTLAAETGVVGFLVFLWLLIAVLRIVKQFNFRGRSLDDSQYWVRAAGYAFVFVWIAECLFREAFFVTAAAGGGTKVMTATVFPWILLGILFAVIDLSRKSIGPLTSAS